MLQNEHLPPPEPLPADQQRPQAEFNNAASCVYPDDLDQTADSGYFLAGDTVALVRSSEEREPGWMYVGPATLKAHGVFVNFINGHRAKKIYPFNWSKVA